MVSKASDVEADSVRAFLNGTRGDLAGKVVSFENPKGATEQVETIKEVEDRLELARAKAARSSGRV